MINKFWFGGLCSADFGVIITEAPADVIPARDVEEIEVPGRSGSLTVDNGRYKDIDISIKCAILPQDDGRTYREQVAALAESFASGAEYKTLITTYDPEHFRMARIPEGLNVEAIAEQAGTFDIGFHCKPQRYLQSGQRPVVLTEKTALINKTLQTAKPYIKIIGEGAGNLTVAGTTVEVKEMAEFLELDSETMNCYKGTENCNSKISAKAFPALPPGQCLISWTGGIERIEITPRWWTL